MNPARPDTHPDLAAILDFLHDLMEELELPYTEEQTDENPNTWFVSAVDGDGYMNSGFVGWDAGKLSFFAHDPLRDNHDEAEGVPAEQSRAWWDCTRVDVFTAHLTGEVREIVARARVASQKALDTGGKV